MSELLNAASRKLETLNELKNLAVKLGQYELGAECRKLEKELFPETDAEISAKEKACKLNLVFRMVELNIEPEICFRISQTLDLFKKKKGKFDLMDASKIVVESQDLFKR